MHKIIAISSIIIYTLSYSTAIAQYAKVKNLINDSITVSLNEVYKQKQFNGFSVAIVNEKGVVYQQGIGYANVVKKKKYTANTIQNIGSISKTLIGIALLKAQELGKLKLDDDINTYLPFKIQNPFAPNAKITLLNLATHTSTIADNEYYLKRNYILKPHQNLKNKRVNFGDEQIFNKYDSILPMKDFLQNVLTTNGKWFTKQSFIEHQPGEIYEYTNVGATLAAYIIELATNEPFDVFTQKYILNPLKMNASGWKFSTVKYANYSQLYQTPDTVLPHYFLITYPDGNFISSANDMAKYLTELIKGHNGNGILLTKESYTQFYKQQLTASNFIKRNEKNPYNDGYNAGIFIGFSAAGNIGHTGGDPGVSTMLFFNPTTKIGRLLITNTNIMNKAGNKQFFAIWDVLDKYKQ